MVEAVARALRLQGVGGLRALALLVGAAAAAIALWHLPGRFRAVDAQIGRYASSPRAQRQLLAARSVDVDTAVFVAARSLIPRGDSYAVVTGTGVTVSTPVTLDAVAPFAGYYLAPRPQVDVRQARWIVSYGGSRDGLGVRLGRVVDVEPGIWIAQVAR